MKAYRLLSTPLGAVSFLPTHLVLGVSFHTINLSPKNGEQLKRPAKIRFVHIHLPFFYVTFSWSTSRATKFNPF